MTSSLSSLVRPILIVLLVVLLPAAARSQEQSQPTAQNGGKSEPQAVKPAADIAAPEAAATTLAVTPPRNETEGTYIVKQGDTLWDISSTLLKDPFLWPFIWKANPSIANADLIYPGNSLVIPSMAPVERAMASPAAASAPAEQEKTAAGQPQAQPVPAAEPAPVDPRQEPESEGGLFGKKSPIRGNSMTSEPEKITRLLLPETVQLPIADKYTVLRAGFVGFDESKDRIVGIVLGEKTIFSYDDVVYVNISSKTAGPGDRFLIFTPLHAVKHPTKGSRYGSLIRVDGVLEVIAPGSGGNYTARIVVSFDSASKKSMLTPYQDPPLIYGNPPAKSKDIEGYVLDIRQDQTISSQNDCIYLDKGSADGVELGDQFVIYDKNPKAIYPKYKVGEAQVIVVKEKTATAIVRHSFDTLVIGDIFEYKK